MPHPRDQRTRDPIKLEHGYRTELDEHVRHNQQLGDRRDFAPDTQSAHDKKGQQYISELQEIIVGSLLFALVPPLYPSLVCLSAISTTYSHARTQKILKAKIEDLEKYAAEVRKQRIFFRNFRETHFGHGEDEDEDEDEG